MNLKESTAKYFTPEGWSVCTSPPPQHQSEKGLEPASSNFTLRRAPGERSGLAYAAGFAALALIFSRFTLIPLLFARQSHIVDISQPDQAIAAIWFLMELPLPGLPAPFALWLGIAAWRDLNQNPDKVGRTQAAIGIIIGFLGTLILIFETYQVTRALWYF